MKSKKLLTISTSLLLLFGVVACGGNTSSSQQSSTSETSQSVVDEEMTKLEAAKDLLYQLYKDDYKEGTATSATYELVTILTSDNVEYTVDWAVNVKEGGADNVIKVGAKEGKKVNVEINIENATKDTTYDLVATIKNASGKSVELTFANLKVPEFKIVTIETWLTEKNTSTPSAIKGVVTAVNKTDAAGAFTLTDATGSVFSYDNPSTKLDLGDEVILSSVYSEHSGFPQLKAPQVVKILNKDKLDTVADKMVTMDINTINSSLASYAETPTTISTKYLKITGGYIIKNSNGYPSLALTADASNYVVNIYYHSSSELLEKVGAQVDLIGVVRGVKASEITLQVQSYTVVKEADSYTPIPEPEIVETTIADLVTTKPTESSKVIYKVTGTWTLDEGKDTYGNGKLSDGTNEIVVYGFASSKEAAKVTWDDRAGSYSYTNPKDYKSMNLVSGAEVTVGMLYDTKYDNYKIFKM